MGHNMGRGPLQYVCTIQFQACLPNLYGDKGFGLGFTDSVKIHLGLHGQLRTGSALCSMHKADLVLSCPCTLKDLFV